MEIVRSFDGVHPSLFVKNDLWSVLRVGDFKQSVKDAFEHNSRLMQEFIFMYFGYGTMSFDRMRVYRILFEKGFPAFDLNGFWNPAIDFCKQRGPSDALRSLKRDEDITFAFETLYVYDRCRLLKDCLESREVFDTFAEAIVGSNLVSRDFLTSLLKGAAKLPRIPLSKCMQKISNGGSSDLSFESQFCLCDVTVAYERGAYPHVHLIGDYGESTRELELSSLRFEQLRSGEPKFTIQQMVGIGEFFYVLSDMRSIYMCDPKLNLAMKLGGFVTPVRGICRYDDSSLLVIDDSGTFTVVNLLFMSLVRLNADVISLASFARVFLDYAEERILVAQVIETEHDVKTNTRAFEYRLGKKIIYSEILASCAKEEVKRFEVVEQIRIEHDADDGFEINSVGFFHDGDVSIVCGNDSVFLRSLIYENDEVLIDNDIVCFNQDGTILKKNGEIQSKERTIAFVPDLRISNRLALTSLPLLNCERF